MEHYEREFFISRIDAGYLKYKCDNGCILHLQSPTKDTLYTASEIYSDTYKESCFLGAPTFDDVVDILVKEDIWTEELESDLKTLPDNIDKLKIELYNAAYKSKLRKKIRKYLVVSKEELERLNDIKHCWDYYTCEGIASFAKWQYIMENSVTYSDNETSYEWDIEPISQLMAHYQTHGLTEEKVRELSRSEPWVGMWAARKTNGSIFPAPLTIEQRALMIWSGMYDNIHESPDCPHQSVLDDDDMLDGWLLVQRKKREKEQTKMRGNEFTQNEKISNAQEVFIVADTAKDAELITDMNEAYGDIVRRSRLKKVQEEKEVKFGAFGDIKRRVQTAATQKFANTVKGK